MTIVVVWQEGNFQWCAADTLVVSGHNDAPITEKAAKIYSIRVATAALDNDSISRHPHYWTHHGFAYAGSVLPAVMTAATASTFLQELVRPGERANPPTFEEIAEFVRRLSERFMHDRRRFDGDGLFSAAFFGWCPHANEFKVARIHGRDDGGFRVELTFPPRPQADGDPWLVLGSAATTFATMLKKFRDTTDKKSDSRISLRAIKRMVAEGPDRTVGGATSIGIAHQDGFRLYYSIDTDQSPARRVFNGLDLDAEVGQVGGYWPGIHGMHSA